MGGQITILVIIICRTLSIYFRITIVSLARLPDKVVNFLNIFGVLLVAFLVQYNRTGVEVSDW